MFRPLSALRASAAVAAAGVAIAVPPAAADSLRLEYGLTSSFSEQAIGVALKRAPMGPMPDGTPLARLADPVTMPDAPAPAAAELAPVVAAAAPVAVAPPAAATPPASAASAPAGPAPAGPAEPAPALAPQANPELDAAVADAMGPTVAEPPQGATELLRDAIVASLKQNPEIQIALAQQDDARFGVDEARAGYLPHVDVQAGYGREIVKTGSSPESKAWRGEASITLNQNLWDFGVTINDIKRARATCSSAQWATRERIEAISYDITNAYLGVLTQQQLLALTEDEITATKKILRIVTVQKDLGLTTPADVGRAQTRLENVQSQLLDRKSALQQARNAYKRLTDHLPARVVDLPPGGTTLPESADAAVAMMADHSPKLAQAVQDRRSLEKQYDSQTGTFFPRIGLMVQGNYKTDVMGLTGRADDARAMVTLSYKLFNGGADRAVRRRIGARLREADYELDRRRREVEQDIRIDYKSLSAARQKIATIDAEIELAQRVAELYRQQFREGRRTVFELLDSEQQLFAARANQVTNGIAMRAAEYRVLQKLGGLFDLVSGGEALPPLVVPAPGSDE